MVGKPRIYKNKHLFSSQFSPAISQRACVCVRESVSHTHPVAAGQTLMYGGIHSTEAHFALGLLLDGCGGSCPLRLQAGEEEEGRVKGEWSFSVL